MNENNDLNTNTFNLTGSEHAINREFYDKENFIDDNELSLEEMQRKAFLKTNRDKKNVQNVQIVAKVMCAATAVVAVASVIGVEIHAPTTTLAILCAFGGGYLINIKKPASEVKND